MVAVAQSLFFRRDAFTMLSHVGYDLRWGRKWPTCCFRVSVDYRSGCWWLQPMERGQQDVVAWLLSGWQGEEGCVLLTHLFVSCLSSERLSPSGINQCGVLFFLENAVIPRRNLKAFVSSLAFHFSWFQIFDCPTIPNASSYRANNRFVIRFFFFPLACQSAPCERICHTRKRASPAFPMGNGLIMQKTRRSGKGEAGLKTKVW